MTNDKLAADHLTDLEIRRGGNWDRREFVKGMVALAGSAGLLGYDPRPSAAEPPPETTKIRLLHSPNFCLAPQYLAEEFLRLEGFSNVDYVESTGYNFSGTLAAGKIDMTMDTVPDLIPAMDAGLPIVALAGIHAGCYELIGNESIRAIRDLKGKKVAVAGLGGGDHVFISSMAAYVGMNPQRDIHWLDVSGMGEAMQFFVDGKADAFLGFPPQPQELRAKKIGHTIVNTTQDRPWSQYFCCMLAGNREFVRKNPVAAKRALRAYLKAADICALEPERVAKFFVAKGYEPRYDLTLEVVKSLPYNRWRQSDPEDTLRFHALRLHEVGMIKSTPQKLIVQGTDWRFLNELKKELKA
jgi:NitT/TauT family transport system substrate-binding protein